MCYWPAILAVWSLMMICCRAHCGRDARVIYLDTETNIDVAIQITVPFGIALPTVKKKKFGRTMQYEPPPSDAGDASDPTLTRLDSFFHYLEICSEACRHKLICELAADPEEFFPVADIFLKELREQQLRALEEEDERFLSYLDAAFQGASDQTSCEIIYEDCSLDARTHFNMDAINFWQFLKVVFHLAFKH